MRKAVTVQSLLCDEWVSCREDWDGQVTSKLCGKPAEWKIRWSDGSETYVCKPCAHGRLRRDNPELV